MHVQTPDVQAIDAPHAIPHPPQFAESDDGSTHVPPQLTWVPVQQLVVQPHAPPTHVRLAGHVCPQLPQLFESLVVSMQTPAQSTVPPGHWQFPC